MNTTNNFRTSKLAVALLLFLEVLNDVEHDVEEVACLKTTLDSDYELIPKDYPTPKPLY